MGRFKVLKAKAGKKNVKKCKLGNFCKCFYNMKNEIA